MEQERDGNVRRKGEDLEERLVLVQRELEFLPVGILYDSDVVSQADRGVVPRGFIAFLPIPECRIGCQRWKEAGPSAWARPHSFPVLAPGLALGVLPSRALSSVQVILDSCARTRVKQLLARCDERPPFALVPPQACDRAQRK